MKPSLVLTLIDTSCGSLRNYIIFSSCSSTLWCTALQRYSRSHIDTSVGPWNTISSYNASQININCPFTGLDKPFRLQEVEATWIYRYEGGNVVSPMHPPPLTTRQRLSRSRAAGKIKLLKNPSDLIENGTCDFLACGSMPQPTAPPHTSTNLYGRFKIVRNSDLQSSAFDVT
jgi:hypothetical protein